MLIAIVAQGLAMTASGIAAWRWYESAIVKIRVDLEIIGHVYEGQSNLEVYSLREMSRDFRDQGRKNRDAAIWTGASLALQVVATGLAIFQI